MQDAVTDCGCKTAQFSVTTRLRTSKFCCRGIEELLNYFDVPGSCFLRYGKTVEFPQVVDAVLGKASSDFVASFLKGHVRNVEPDFGRIDACLQRERISVTLAR